MNTQANNPSLWWTKTWSPLHGCAPVSPGCDRCWALSMARRHGANPAVPWSTGLVAENGWTGKIVSAPDAMWDAPKRWRGKHVVLAFAMTDLFAKARRPHGFYPDVRRIARALEVMRDCPEHTFCVLTKRPENIQWALERIGSFTDAPENVWLGVSVENQETADARIPALLDAWPGHKFLSLEPMLGEARLCWPWAPNYKGIGNIEWVIAGPETGPGRRPASHFWFEDLHADCKRLKRPFFFKGWGGEESPVREFPKEMGL